MSMPTWLDMKLSFDIEIILKVLLTFLFNSSLSLKSYPYFLLPLKSSKLKIDPLAKD